MQLIEAPILSLRLVMKANSFVVNCGSSASVRKKMTSGVTHNSIVVKIPQSAVSVSHMSNLLRVLQATVREISSSQLNELYPAGLPILVANFEASKDQTTIRMSFGDSINRNSNPIVSTTTNSFDVFMSMYVDFLNQDAQSDLWGGKLVNKNARLGKGVERRFVQVTGILKKIPGTRMTVSELSILFNENGFGVS